MPRITKRTWTKEQDDILTANYPFTRNSDLALLIGKTESAVMARSFKLKLFKTPEFHKEHSKKGWYTPGSSPANKGRKQSEYMTIESIAKTAATRFKKGNEPHNTKHDGFERISKDGYIEVRIRKGKFQLKHRAEWEKVNGKIPKGHILVCLGDNIQDCRPQNWECITMAENMERNSGVINLPDTMVATYLAASSRKVDAELKAEILKHPELIQAKRTHILLNRKINNHG